MTELPLQVEFRRTEQSWAEAAAAALRRGALGIPLPVPRFGLPDRITLALDEHELRVLCGSEELERCRRGEARARVFFRDARGVQLVLRLPSGREAHLSAPADDDAVALVELLAQDTRVAAGVDRATDDAVLALGAALPEKLLLERDEALRSISAVVAPGERPMLLVAADRGMSMGVALLTDRALLWWSGGRKDPVAIPLPDIAGVAHEQEDHSHYLYIRHRDKTTRLDDVAPPERVRELVAALRAARRSAD